MIIYETLHTKYYTVAGKVTWFGKRIIVQLFRQHLGFHGKIGWRVFRETIPTHGEECVSLLFFQYLTMYPIFIRVF